MPEYLASIVAVIHGLVLVLLLVGAFLGAKGVLKKYETWQNLYLLTVILTIASFLAFRSCFLTNLEKSLRSSPYEGGFISYHLSFIGLNVPDIAIYWILTPINLIGLISTIYWMRKK